MSIRALATLGSNESIRSPNQNLTREHRHSVSSIVLVFNDHPTNVRGKAYGALFMGVLVLLSCIALMVLEYMKDTASNWTSVLIIGIILGFVIILMGTHTLLTTKRHPKNSPPMTRQSSQIGDTVRYDDDVRITIPRTSLAPKSSNSAQSSSSRRSKLSTSSQKSKCPVPDAELGITKQAFETDTGTADGVEKDDNIRQTFEQRKSAPTIEQSVLDDLNGNESARQTAGISKSATSSAETHFTVDTAKENEIEESKPQEHLKAGNDRDEASDDNAAIVVQTASQSDPRVSSQSHLESVGEFESAEHVEGTVEEQMKGKF